MKKKNFIRKGLLACALSAVSIFTTACRLEDLFIFPTGIVDPLVAKGLESFEGCNNSIFFALYNYYGFDGQNFTNRWLGMLDALNNHGIEVSNWRAQKDATQFEITRTDACDLPEDAKIYMVNNQEWDSGIQFTKPIARYKPMAIISTCNGVEFAAAPIKSSGISISNGTLGGFSPSYQAAFKNGTLKYLAAKYAAHILPIVAASVNAVDTGEVLRMPETGEALVLPIENWAVQTLNEYNALDLADNITMEAPALRYLNIKHFFDKTSPDYGAEKLIEWTGSQTKESIIRLQEENKTNVEQDVKREGRRLKVGLLQPSAVNDQVQKYVDYVKGYCAEIFNYDVITQNVSSTVNQIAATDALIGSNVDFIISFQDDTDRAKSIINANKAGVYFAVGGAALTNADYQLVKNCQYYIGSIGTTVEADRKATREMTEYYLQCMIERAKGMDELYAFQKAHKGIVEEEE